MKTLPHGVLNAFYSFKIWKCCLLFCVLDDSENIKFEVGKFFVTTVTQDYTECPRENSNILGDKIFVILSIK